MDGYDYSGTGIYERHQTQETERVNQRLEDMYRFYFGQIKENVKVSGFNATGYNGLQLLTCFDAYLNSGRRIMCYGQEAHTDSGSLTVFPDHYRTSAFYSYDYAIAHYYDEPIPPDHRPWSQYLRVRRILSGIDVGRNDDDEDKVLSLLNNNLNKTSLGGDHTPAEKYLSKRYRKPQEPTIDDMAYFPFTFRGFTGTVYHHELDILRPTHLVFLSGKGYDNHIYRDLGEQFYRRVIAEKIRPERLTFNNPVLKASVGNEEISACFGIHDYFKNSGTMKIVYAYHPSAHLPRDTRAEYERRLKEFTLESERSS